MLPADINQVREDAHQTSTDVLLDWVTLYRDTLTAEQVEVFETELRGRGVGREEIVQHAQLWANALRGRDGEPRLCSLCRRPALTRAWGWQRLWLLPFFPRKFFHCDRHFVDPNSPIFAPWLKRTAKWAAVGCGVLLVLAIVAWWGARSYYGHTAERELQEYMAELDATNSGWRIEELEAARAVVPEEENSARVIVAAKKLIPADWPTPPAPPGYGPAFMGSAATPPALEERLNEVPPEVQLDGEFAAELYYEMERASVAVEKARQLASMPRGRHRIVYAPDFVSTLLTDQQKTREITELLCLDAQLLAENGDIDAALASCRGAINAGRSIGDEPLLISMLVRIACVGRTHRYLERTLAQGRASEPALRQVQELLADENRQELFLNTLRGERAGLHRLAGILETGGTHFEELSAVNDLGPRLGRHRGVDGSDVILFIVGPGFLKKNHRWLLQAMTELIEIVATAEDRDAAIASYYGGQFRQMCNNHRYEAMLARLLLPAVDRVGEAEYRHHATVRCSMAALAAERYRLRHQRWPASFQALVDDGLLDAVPLDPFDGQPLRFLLTEDGLLIYSIGPDRKDNGGNINRQRSIEPGTDLGFQLWDPARRRQPAESLVALVAVDEIDAPLLQKLQERTIWRPERQQELLGTLELIKASTTKSKAFLPVLAKNLSYKPVADPGPGIQPADEEFPVAAVVCDYGFEAVDALLEQIRKTDVTDPVHGGPEHRDLAVKCLIRIYEPGGRGVKKARARIELEADKARGEEKERLRNALELPVLKAAPE
jgi:hypothetical protein